MVLIHDIQKCAILSKLFSHMLVLHFFLISMLITQFVQNTEVIQANHIISIFFPGPYIPCIFIYFFILMS